ncbi:MAG TPA: hypothetical protein VFF18_15900 [Woeseiaceae bacterium]|nr:hypothetical protein [Woeseiaceae bacterium]
MKRFLTRVTVAGALTCLGMAAYAEPAYEEVWTCKLEEGKTIEEVQAANSKWLAMVSKEIGKGKIRSSVVRSVVGNADIFLFVDTYPDLATWSATKEFLGSDEGEAADELFEGISDCSENRLYRRDYTE